MPQTQVREETAKALGEAIAQAWGAGASLEPDGGGTDGDGAAAPAAAIGIGAETIWLAGEFPPGLPEAVAAAIGGEVSAETPPLDPAATCLAYRWGWAEQSGGVEIHALPETWAAFGDGEPAGEIAPGDVDPTAADPAPEAEAPPVRTEPEAKAPPVRSEPEPDAPPARSEPEAEAPPARSEPEPGAAQPSAGRETLAVLPPLTDRRTGGASRGIELLLDVPLDVTVELGRAQKRIREVLELRPGSVIGLDRPAGEPVNVLVNGKAIARGEVIVIDENFGVRITDVLSQVERLNHLA